MYRYFLFREQSNKHYCLGVIRLQACIGAQVGIYRFFKVPIDIILTIILFKDHWFILVWNGEIAYCSNAFFY